MKCVILPLLFLCSALAAPSDVQTPLQLLSVGNRQFTAAVYREILKASKGNLIFSPFSAETVLALTSEGAKGETRKELIDALHLPESQDQIQKAFKEILPKLKLDTRNVKLLAANKIYVADNVKLEDNFKGIAVSTYESDVTNVDFKKGADAANEINQWVEKQTNQKIKDLIKSDQLTGDTAMILVNALYLSAKWSIPFKEGLTKNEKFYKTADETLELPTMNNVDFYNYYKNNETNVQFLEMQYKSEGLSMVVALPEREGLTALESNLEKVFEPKSWTRVVVDVKLPKFTINSQIKFVNILKSLGAKKMFGTEADLTGMSSTHKNLHVSDVVQKAFISVSESGTEAAAATAVAVESRAGRIIRPPIETFHADHPFIYVIKYHDIILFAGKVESQ